MALYLYVHSSYIESAIGCWTWGPLSLLARLLFPFFFFFKFWELSAIKANPILYNVIFLLFAFLFLFFFSKTKNGKNKNKNTRDARPKNSFPLKSSPRKTLYRRRHVITPHQCKILTGQYALLTMVLVLLSLKWHCYLLPVQPPEDKSRNFNHSFFLSSNHEEEAVFTLNFRSFSLYLLSLSF